MKVLVTGAAGCLGTELCLLLRSQGHEVVGVDNLSRYSLLGELGMRDQQKNVEVIKTAGVEFIQEDFALLHLKPRPAVDAVVHTAAQVCHSRKGQYDNALDDVGTNVLGTVGLLEHYYRTQTPFLFISSSKVYGENFDKLKGGHTRYGISEDCPLGDQTHITFFGASKAAADLFCQMYARKYGFPVGVFRPGCFTSKYALAAEAQNWLPWLMHCAKRGEPFNLYGDGGQSRDLLHAADLAQACAAWVKSPQAGVWNIGGEAIETINMAIKRVERMLEKKVNVVRHPPRAGDIYSLRLASGKISNAYGWRQTIFLNDIYQEIMEAVQ